MLIALDYDGTYTEDPEMWNDWIRSARARGHKVIACTMRYEESEGAEVKEALIGRVNEIYFTSRRAKADYLLELGLVPKIWIDDNPMWIYQGAL